MNAFRRTAIIWFVLATPLGAEIITVDPNPLGFLVQGLAYDATEKTLYGSTSTSELVSIDLQTGKASVIASLPSGDIRGLAFDPQAEALYGTNRTTGNLLMVDIATLDATTVGPLGFPCIDGLAFDPTSRVLYGCNGCTDELVTIDTATGAATVVGPIGFSSVQGLAFDVEAQELFGTAGSSPDSHLLRIDTATGAGSLVGTTSSSYIGGLSFDPISERLFGAQAGLNVLLSIDSTTADAEMILSSSIDFLLLQTAVDSAQAGDVVFLMPGFHGDAVIDKGIRIIAQGKDEFSASCGQLTFRDVPLGEHAGVFGTNAWSVAIQRCMGTVTLQDIRTFSLSAFGEGLYISDSRDVRIHQSVIGPQDTGDEGADSIRCINSRVELVESTVTGGDACPGFLCFQGGHGIVASDSNVSLMQTDVFGGNGQDGDGGFGVLVGANSRVTVAGAGTSTIAGGSGLTLPDSPSVKVMAGGQLRYSGVTLVDGLLGPGVLASPPDPVLSVTGVKVPGTSLIYRLVGPPGADATLLIGRKPKVLATPSVWIEQLVEPQQILALGAIPPSGVLLATYSVPAFLPFGSDLIAQAEVSITPTIVLRSNSIYAANCSALMTVDCNANGIPDDCDASVADCNGNGVPDGCDIAAGTSSDCNLDGVPDECEADCNANAIPDACDLAAGTSLDCNANGRPDECDISTGASFDCNGNAIPDECDIAAGAQDLNSNGVPDSCEPDCNTNGIPDDLDIATGFSVDVNANSIPDECEPDCNSNGLPDDFDISTGFSTDCNDNIVPDECEPDINGNGLPDECEVDKTYCMAKVNSDTCSAGITFTGTPSLTSPFPFTIRASLVVVDKTGFLFYGLNGPAVAPFEGGTLCVSPPTRRTPNQGSSGFPGIPCDGSFAFDFNAWIQSGNEPFAELGSQVNAQYWYRDPSDTFGVGLTDAVEFFVGP